MLDGAAISALVVGGGRVAARKVTALVDAGARVHVVALTVADEIERLAQSSGRIRVTAEPYVATHLADCTLVVAATDDAELNASVARDATARGLLVNVVDAPELGTFVTPAVHRAGDVVVAVTAGRLPGAAAQVRDSIARRLDNRYAHAVRELAALRRSMIDDGNRDRWQSAAHALIGDDFCEQVESGALSTRMAEWR
jgi:precorrin-2 dehydrogenase / sirohydrochlorin ferrochelatase